MIQLQDLNMDSLILSKDGIHLSAYITNTSHIEEIRSKIRNVILDATEYLQNALTPDEIHRFLQPVEELLYDKQILQRLNNNFALFRKKDSFKIISIPIDFKEITVVADSYHVKPLLKWHQQDKKFLLLGINNTSINIFRGSDSFSLNLLKSKKIKKNEMNQFIREDLNLWFNEFISQNVQLEGQILYIAGSPELAKKVFRHLTYTPIFSNIIYSRFAKNSVNKIFNTLTNLHSDQKIQAFQSILNEYYFAKEQKLTQNDIFEIAKSAVQGKIKKLMIKDNINIFGKVCKLTGDLTIHYTELDHEDDDILDDLAQIVLANDGQVFITDNNKTPEELSVAAILKDEFSPERHIQLHEHLLPNFREVI